MKASIRISTFFVLFFSVFFLSAQIPFSRGVNLTGWFASNSAQSIPFTKFTKNDLVNIKSMGCDVIRQPIILHNMTNGAPDYEIDPLVFKYLDQVINWTEELQINLILDNHSVDVAQSKTVEDPLLKIWIQMARHFKHRSTSIFYEILHEPNTMLPSDWEAIQAKVVDSIRAYDTKHTIIVTGAAWGGISGLKLLKKLEDPNLIYSFHFYDPFLFTHQGASWANPPMVDLANVPFPYDETRMPDCPASLKGTWVEASLDSFYKTEGTVAKLKSTIDEAVDYATTNGVKIFCGELGVYNQTSIDYDRVKWYRVVTDYLKEKSIPFTTWDYQREFGLFIKGSREMFEYDLNRPLVEAIGFTPPPFKEYVFTADTIPFEIYTDFSGKGIQANLPAGGEIDIISPDARQGEVGIYITDITQYTFLDFDFKMTRDLSKLVEADYTIDFWFKADAPNSDIVLRFLDTRSDDPEDHPWRKDFTINSTLAPFDGQWHFVQVKLKDFIDAGSWDGSWFDSTNSFDWKAVDRMQIVAESMALTGKKFWFDDIRIDGTPLTVVDQKMDPNPFKAIVFPNPMSENATLHYDLSEAGLVNVAIYDLAGKKLATLADKHQAQGRHQLALKDGLSDLTNGVYLCRIGAGQKSTVLKLIVNR